MSDAPRRPPPEGPGDDEPGEDGDPIQSKDPTPAWVQNLDQARVDLVEQLMRSCMTSGTIARLLAKQWDLSERQARRYISAVLLIWRRDSLTFDAQSGMRRELRRAQLEGVLERCLTAIDPEFRRHPDTGELLLKPDFKTAVVALDRLCKIDGIFEPTRVEVNHTGEMPIESMKSMDRASELKALIDKYDAQRKAREERAAKAH